MYTYFDFIRECENGNLALLNEMYTHIFPNRNSSKAIYVACNNNHVDVVKWLIEKLNMFDDKFKNLHTISAFETACINNNIQVVDMLARFDINILDDKYCYERSEIFAKVCNKGNVEMAKHLLFLDPKIKLLKGTFVSTCCNGNIKMAKWLYEFNLDDNLELNDALHAVCASGRLYVAKWLYSVGADIYAIIGQKTCCEKAFEFSRIKIVKWIAKLDINLFVESVNLRLNKISICNMRHYLRDIIEFYEKCKLVLNKLRFTTETVDMVMTVIRGKTLPDHVYEVDDIVILFLLKFNHIDDLNRLNLPHVKYEIYNGFITNWEIVTKTKSARNV